MKSIILLSSGLDSLVNLKQAFLKTEVKLVLTFDYGQKAVFQEIAHSKLLAKKFNLNHKIIKLKWLKEIVNISIPHIYKKDLKNFAMMKKTAQKVWIPNRNAVFINIAASYAEVLKCKLIITGFNKEEAITFKDNSQEFINSINESLKFSTLNKVKVLSYTMNMNKTEIVKFAQKIEAPLEYVWSCYHNSKKMCGKCESCVRLIRALDETKSFYRNQLFKKDEN